MPKKQPFTIRDRAEYLILTPTYNRGRLLARVVEKLQDDARMNGHTAIHIVQNDCSTEDLDEYAALRMIPPTDWYRLVFLPAGKHRGKEKFHETLTLLYQQARHIAHDYVVAMPDDMLPSDRFFTRITEHFKEVQAKDSTICAMNIFCSVLRNWGTPRYLDNAFIADGRLLHALGYQVRPSSKRWRPSSRGSGTGCHVTQSIQKKKKIQIAPCQDVSYLLPMDAPSMMYPKDGRPEHWWRDNYVDKNADNDKRVEK